jgi:hypothetical protein
LPPGGKTFNEFEAAAADMANGIIPTTNRHMIAKLRIWFKSLPKTMLHPLTKALCLAYILIRILTKNECGTSEINWQ